MTNAVVDDAANGRFLVREEGSEAQLTYRTRPGKLVLVHTEVPPELGGRGIATRLVMAALDRARRTGETVVPWCPFARRWMREHLDQLGDLSVDWTPPPH